MSAEAPDLPGDIELGLRQLKLAGARRVAPEVLHQARIQRWAHEDVLRSLIEAEQASREAAGRSRRLRQAAFPVEKRLEDLDRAASSVPGKTLEYLAGLEWIASRENLVLCGPSGTGKTHLAIALGYEAIEQGLRVRYLSGAQLVEHLFGGRADASVGRMIEQLLRADLLIVDELGFEPLDATGCQLLFRFVAAAYERRSLCVASHFPFEQWGRFIPEQATAVALLDRLLHHAVVCVTEGESFRMRAAAPGWSAV
jgi:DNA replication protein DnaC